MLQISTSNPALTIGGLFTVTVPEAVAVAEVASVTVTEYVVVPEGQTLFGPAPDNVPGFHEYEKGEVPPETVAEILVQFPAQIDAELTVTLKLGAHETVTTSWSIQPFPAVH